MKLSSTAWATALLLSASSMAENGLIYLYNSHTLNHAPTSLDTSDARLLIAHGFGLSRFHRLDDASGPVIEIINGYEARPRTSLSMFQQQDTRRPQSLVLIEGIDAKTLNTLQTSQPQPLILEHCPPPTSNVDLLRDLEHQHNSVHGSQNLLRPSASTSDPVTLLQHWIDKVEEKKGTEDLILYSTGFEHIAATLGSGSMEYKEAIRSLMAGLNGLQSRASDSLGITVVLMPLESKGLFKRSNPGSWGTYAKMKRQSRPVPGSGRPFIEDTDVLGDVNAPVADLRPEILEEQGYTRVASESTSQAASATLGAAASSSAVYDTRPVALELEEVLASQTNETVEPPRGILPACFPKESTCQSVTHNCSGHGSCQSSYSSKDGSSTCWSCACRNTREDTGNGRYKTTIWAGPACQKRDVSVPFWLLGSTAVGLLSAVAWGVGLLYSMGSEELPSVIGAGVAGPRAK